MYIFPELTTRDRISLKRRSVISPAQIARAVGVGVFFALIFAWILPDEPARAEPELASVTSI